MLVVIVVGLIVAIAAWTQTPSAAPITQGASPVASPMAPPRPESIASSLIAGLHSAAYLPEPTGLGDGWRLERVGVPGADPEVFVDSANAFYTGPQGGRIEVFAYVTKSDRTSVQQSWEGASAVFENLAYKTQYRQRNDQAVPAECDNGKSSEGTDLLFQVSVGITMCSVGADAIVLAVVSGEYNGQTGADASGAVVALSLNLDS
jgi:hypothetical protein